MLIVAATGRRVNQARAIDVERHGGDAVLAKDAAPKSPMRHVRSRGEIRLGFRAQDGAIRISAGFQGGCLKFRLPRTPRHGIPCAVLLNTSGGLAGGDRLTQRVDWGAKSAAIVTTQAEPGRSFVIVCTDGRDTSSWAQPEDVIESAKHSNAVVYVVASSGARRWAPLKTLADVTGGRLIEIESSTQIAAEFKKILEDFRSRYVLTYIPAGVTSGGYHRLDVRVRRAQTKVTARPGYF